jgi:integrase
MGLKMGEALGLKWSDTDFEAGTLRVHRQLQRMREGGGLVFSEPTAYLWAKKRADERTRTADLESHYE